MSIKVRIKRPLFQSGRPKYGASIYRFAPVAPARPFIDTLEECAGPETLEALRNQHVERFHPLLQTAPAEPAVAVLTEPTTAPSHVPFPAVEPRTTPNPVRMPAPVASWTIPDPLAKSAPVRSWVIPDPALKPASVASWTPIPDPAPMPAPVMAMTPVETAPIAAPVTSSTTPDPQPTPAPVLELSPAELAPTPAPVIAKSPVEAAPTPAPVATPTISDRVPTPAPVIELSPVETAPTPARITPAPGLLQRAFSWLRKRCAERSAKQLRVTETVSLGEKRFVAILHVENRKFLIGGGASNVALLTQLDGDAEVSDVPVSLPAASRLRGVHK